jgi:hypothetical protein
MSRISVKWNGMARAQRNLGALKRVRAEEGKRRAGGVLVFAARARAPRDTGTLATSLRVDSDGTHVVVHTARAFWGLFHEYGTSRMSARPWFRPTFVDRVGEMLAGVGTGVWATIRASLR